MTHRNLPRSDYLPHLERERVFRPAQFELPDVIDTMLDVPSAVVVESVWDLERRHCVGCGHVVRVAPWLSLDRRGHCPGCARQTYKKRLIDGRDE